MNKIIVAIDVQRDFMDEGGMMYHRCVEFLNCNHKHTIIGTTFTNAPGSFYEKYLNYEHCMETPVLDYRPDRLIDKFSKYSAADDIIKELKEIKKPYDRNILYLMGCDMDGCLLATAFALWDMKTDFRILSDFIYISEGSRNDDRFERYRCNVEELLYKCFGSLMTDSETEGFRKRFEIGEQK